MKKIIFIIVALLTFQLVIAAQGCFLNEDSPLYCQTINQIEAEEECNILENCNLGTDFILNQDCSNNNKCEKIFCKSSCSEKLKKDCPAGELSKDEILKWCSPGCCKFNYLNKNFCEYKESKWFCEVEAINKRSDKINYDLKLNENECQTFCQKDVEERKKETKSAEFELVSTKIKLAKEESKTNKENKTELQNNLTSTDNEKNNFLLISIFLILLVLAVIYFLRKKKPVLKPSDSKELSKKWTPFLVPKNDSESKLEKMKEKHRKLFKKKKREQFLLESGLPLDKKKEVDKLNKLVRLHQKVKEKVEKEKPWKDLKNVIEKKGIIAIKKDKTIEELRKMSK